MSIFDSEMKGFKLNFRNNWNMKFCSSAGE